MILFISLRKGVFYKQQILKIKVSEIFELFFVTKKIEIKLSKKVICSKAKLKLFVFCWLQNVLKMARRFFW